MIAHSDDDTFLRASPFFSIFVVSSTALLPAALPPSSSLEPLASVPFGKGMFLLQGTLQTL